jgi:hypothetical protein
MSPCRRASSRGSGVRCLRKKLFDRVLAGVASVGVSIWVSVGLSVVISARLLLRKRERARLSAAAAY